MEKVLTQNEMAKALNEWMRRYTEAPEDFARKWEAVNQFLKEQAEGVEPSYGRTGAAYMMKLQDELNNDKENTQND